MLTTVAEARARYVQRRRAIAPWLTALAKQPAMCVALFFLAFVIITALLAPFIAPNPINQNLSLALRGPSWSHILGTDELGRDLWARVAYGGRTSLLLAAAVTALAVAIGVPLGLVAGYFQSILDTVIMRVMDVLLAVPAVIIAMTSIAILGRSTGNLIVVIAVVSVPAIARLTRSGTLTIKQQNYVAVSKMLGANRRRLLFRTIFPNVIAPVLVLMAITAENAILLEAALDFLGLGTPPPAPSWGGMLSASELYLTQDPWYALSAGIALIITTLSLDTIARGSQRLIQASEH